MLPGQLPGLGVVGVLVDTDQAGAEDDQQIRVGLGDPVAVELLGRRILAEVAGVTGDRALVSA